MSKTLTQYGQEACAPCRAQREQAEKLAQENDCVFYYVDVTKEESVIEENNLRTTPTYILRENGVEIARATGDLADIKKVLCN